jgi:hypothetical protein
MCGLNMELLNHIVTLKGAKLPLKIKYKFHEYNLYNKKIK